MTKARWMRWSARWLNRSPISAGSLLIQPHPHMPDPPIAVAMSGGVDSSVVAGMLQARGERVVGLTMQLWNQRRLPELQGDRATGRCCSLDDVYDARYVAQRLGIPYYVMKFDQFLEMAEGVGADRMATGHYAQIRWNPDNGRYEMLKSIDRAKDQTYFLFGLT